jgi:hypothetical protein
MIDDLIEITNGEKETWQRLIELHISLSKTFPIRFHHIESIRKSIQNELSISMIKYKNKRKSIEMENFFILLIDFLLELKM